jgi:prepilin-type N-terminal cleavage/methylation domain-containing protein
LFRVASRSAFTLVEMMLAIAIFSGVIAAIYSTWTAILRSAHIGQIAAADAQRQRMAVRTIEESLASIQFFRANSPYYSFIADTSEEDAYFSFVAHLPRSFPRSGRFGDLLIRRVSFSVEADGDGSRALMLRQQPLLFDPDIEEEENPLVLARNLTAFQLEFWGPNSREWEPEWLVTNQLPRFVRFTLAWQNPGQGLVGAEHEITRVVTLPISGNQPSLSSSATPGLVPGGGFPTNQIPGPPPTAPGGLPGGLRRGGR